MADKVMPAYKLWVLEERGEGEELVAFFPAANGKGYNGQFKAPLTGRLCWLLRIRSQTAKKVHRRQTKGGGSNVPFVRFSKTKLTKSEQDSYQTAFEAALGLKRLRKRAG